MHPTKNFTIQKWIKARQELIVALNKLCSYRPFLASEFSSLEGDLQEFCQLLMDYVALGHFEVFEHIAQICESKYANTKLSKTLLESLLKTTIKALDFNDRYHSTLEPNQLESDLSSLAESLAQRFEWEDGLISQYRAAIAHQMPAQQETFRGQAAG